MGLDLTLLVLEYESTEYARTKLAMHRDKSLFEDILQLERQVGCTPLTGLYCGDEDLTTTPYCNLTKVVSVKSLLPILSECGKERYYLECLNDNTKIGLYWNQHDTQTYQ